MNGRQEPNAQLEQNKAPNDDEIIDLTQIVATGDDDEIIELTDILEQPDQPAASVDALETPINPHTDDADNGSFSDEIIELTDIEEAESTVSEEIDWDGLDSALEESFGDMPDLNEKSGPALPADEASEEITDDGWLPANGIDAPDAAETDPAASEEVGLAEFDSALEDTFGGITDPDSEAGMDVIAIETPEEALETADTEDEAFVSEVDAANIGEDELAGGVLDDPEKGTTLETDIAPPTAETEPADEDEEIIDLLDVAAFPESEGAGAPVGNAGSPTAEAEPADEDEEIIDLLDVAAFPESEGAGAPVENAGSPTAEAEPADEDEEIVDLLDVADLDAPKQNEAAPASAEETETVIDPMDVAGAAPAAADDVESADRGDSPSAAPDAGPEADPEAGAATEDMETPEEAAETAGPDDDFMVLGTDGAMIDAAESTSAEACEREAAPDTAATEAQADAVAPLPPRERDAEPSGPTTPPASSATESISVTAAQLETAVERVIEKIYGQKIEQLLIQAIETTVKREIEKIKNALFENGDDAANWP